MIMATDKTRGRENEETRAREHERGQNKFASSGKLISLSFAPEKKKEKNQFNQCSYCQFGNNEIELSLQI